LNYNSAEITVNNSYCIYIIYMVYVSVVFENNLTNK